jgi:methyl-accepting chemotaxis protein
MLPTYRYHRLDEKTRVLSTRLLKRSALKVLRIQQRTSESAEAIRSIVTTITRINEAIGSIAAAIEEQGATTAEIARSAQHAALGTQRALRTSVRLILRPSSPARQLPKCRLVPAHQVPRRQ